MKYLVIVASLLLTFMTACTKTSPAGNENLLYSNGFESEDDLMDFYPYIGILSDKTPKDGGDSSLYVCGGCIVPHMYMELGPFDEDMSLLLRLSAKSDYQGSIHLRTDQERIELIVEGDDWKNYESESLLDYTSGEILKLTIVSGGFVPVSTYIDNLEIEIITD